MTRESLAILGALVHVTPERAIDAGLWTDGTCVAHVGSVAPPHLAEVR